ARTYEALGRPADALKLCAQVLALRQARLGPTHPETLTSMYNLATGYAGLRRFPEAVKLHQEALALRQTHPGPDHPDTLESMWGVAGALMNDGRRAEAVPIIDECVRLAAGKVVDPGLIPGVVELRLRHFQEARDAAGCRATAELWEKLG